MSTYDNPSAPAAPNAPMASPPPQAQPYPTQQMGYPPQQGYAPQHGNGHDAAEMARRYIRTPETKEFFRTSEFMIWIVMTAMVFIAAAIHNNFSAPQAWPLAMGLSAAYILSRGIAKSGTRRGEPEGRREAGSF